MEFIGEEKRTAKIKISDEDLKEMVEKRVLVVGGKGRASRYLLRK